MPYQFNEKGSIESVGKYGFKIEIHVSVNRQLSEDEVNEIHRTIEKLGENINYQSTLLDPEVQERTKLERIEILELFNPSKEYPFWVKEIPNEYTLKTINPWYIVYTYKGPIKIGWRKRVILIDWTDSDIIGKAEELFPNEGVTMSESYEKIRYIHAWGYNKAREYIKKLLK